jgi:hypothetical protein
VDEVFKTSVICTWQSFVVTYLLTFGEVFECSKTEVHLHLVSWTKISLNIWKIFM